MALVSALASVFSVGFSFLAFVFQPLASALVLAFSKWPAAAAAALAAAAAPAASAAGAAAAAAALAAAAPLASAFASASAF